MTSALNETICNKLHTFLVKCSIVDSLSVIEIMFFFNVWDGYYLYTLVGGKLCINDKYA